MQKRPSQETRQITIETDLPPQQGADKLLGTLLSLLDRDTVLLVQGDVELRIQNIFRALAEAVVAKESGNNRLGISVFRDNLKSSVNSDEAKVGLQHVRIDNVPYDALKKHDPFIIPDGYHIAGIHLVFVAPSLLPEHPSSWVRTTTLGEHVQLVSLSPEMAIRNADSQNILDPNDDPVILPEGFEILTSSTASHDSNSSFAHSGVIFYLSLESV